MDAKVVEGGSGCSRGPNSSCCGGGTTAEQISGKVGYSSEEMGAVPDGSNLGLGCGNPLAHAAIHEGDTVLIWGSGAVRLLPFCPEKSEKRDGSSGLT